MIQTRPSRFVLLAVLCAILACFATEAGAEVRNPHGVAVIVGNKDYRHRDIPAVSFAHRDADAFRRYVVDVLGFKPENVIDLRDATRAKLASHLRARTKEGERPVGETPPGPKVGRRRVSIRATGCRA